ncbi:MAG: GNAT family N-acetyltransferase [Allorhizobium sp.]
MRSGMNVQAAQGGLYCRLPNGGDFDSLAAMRRDDALQSTLLTVPRASDDAAVHDWIERRVSEPAGLFRVLTISETGDAIGFVQVSQVHVQNGHGHGGIALRSHARGRGFGRMGLELLLGLAARDLGLIKLLAEIRADNLPSARLHESTGYRKVGRLERHFRDRDGSFHDVDLYECILEERRQ